MRILIGFFGLNRSLRITAESIIGNIYQPLLAAGHEIRSIAHFNAPAFVAAPRSREMNVPLDPRDHIEVLGLELCWIEPQCEPDPEKMALAMAARDWLKDPDGTIRKNILFQLRSLARLWELMTLMGTASFDAFLFLRPDLYYLDPLDPAEVSSVTAGTDIVTPSWHQWRGLNDRFAFCSVSGAQVYAHLRYVELTDAIRGVGALHGESILAYTVRKAALVSSFTSLRAARVRASGERYEEDFSL